jgi:hypothetical protein
VGNFYECTEETIVTVTLLKGPAMVLA